MKLKIFFNKLINIGVHQEHNNYERFSRHILNGCLIASFVVVLGNLINDFVREEYPGVYLAIVFLSFTIIVLFLNSKNKFELCKLLVLIILPLMILVMTILCGEQLEIGYIYLVLIPATILYYKSKQARNSIIIYITILFLLGHILSINNVPIFTDIVDPFNSISLIVLAIILNVYSIGYTVSEVFKSEAKISQQFEILNVQHQNLEKLNKNYLSINELVSLVAHDLSGPAGSFHDLTNKVSYLLKQHKYDELMLLGSNFESMGNRFFIDLNNLLNWVLLQKDHFRITNIKVNLFEVVNESCVLLSPIFNKNNDRILNQIPGHLEMVTDPHILKVVFRNLIENALKYSNQKVSISVSQDLLQNYISILVKDKGKGFDKSILDLVGGDNILTIHSKTGHGLGLSICIKFLGLLNGKLHINSEPCGSTIEVRLPINNPIQLV